MPRGVRWCCSLSWCPLTAVGMGCEQIGMVIDLTNTWKYYSLHEWVALGVKHVKIACAGRDGPPEPEVRFPILTRAC
eukprot:1192300-Prorocentrum_minimum.AAC.4